MQSLEGYGYGYSCGCEVARNVAMRRESGVVKSWGQELEVESGRAKLSQELGLGRVGSLGSA